MKPGNIFLTAALLVAAAVLLYALRTPPGSHPEEFSVHGAQTVSFAGHTVELPDEWKRDAFSSSDAALVLKHGDAQLTLTDQRSHPEIPGQFVASWQRAYAQSGGTHPPQSIDGYSDSDTNDARLACVSERWDQPTRPLRLTCLGRTGGWRITLSGADPDLPSLDMLARQMPGLEGR